MADFLRVDEKWSIQFDPGNNDRPRAWFRSGERHSDFLESNACVALFYALLEKDREVARVADARDRWRSMWEKDQEAKEGLAVRINVLGADLGAQIAAIRAEIYEIRAALPENQEGMTMTDEQIIDHLKRGKTLTFGCNGRNLEIMALMHGLEQQGLIETEDMGLSQETRRTARWIGPATEETEA